MVSGTLAQLYTVFGLKLDSGGAASPIGRMGDFPSVPPLKGPSASQAGFRPSQSGLRASG